MSIRINDVAPDFTADSTAGKLSLHDWIGSSYAILFSHPKDFTPVCTTEFGAVAQLAPEFAKRNTKVMGVSVDNVEEHKKWKRDIESFSGAPADFPIIDDTSLAVSKLYDMLPADAGDTAAGRTAATNATVRTVFASTSVTSDASNAARARVRNASTSSGRYPFCRPDVCGNGAVSVAV